MQKQFQAFVGVDVSKRTLDVCWLKAQQHQHRVFDNTLKGVTQCLGWLTTQLSLPLAEVLFCLEHTGIYTLPLCSALSTHGYHFALVPALQIRLSSGMKRGKTDKADARTIACYAQSKGADIQLYELPAEKLLKLKFLLTHRNRLVKTRKALLVATTEPAGFVDKAITRGINHQNRQLITSLEQKIKQTEKQLLQLIASDERMQQVYTLLLSVPGIGSHIATHLIACTHCFTTFTDSRKFACYAGIAPFEHTSGTSVRGKARVSHLAHKRTKALLNLAVLAARKKDQQIRSYYDRKLKEGKNPMLILNNLRNKLVARIFATIKRQTPYVLTMQYTA